VRSRASKPAARRSSGSPGAVSVVAYLVRLCGFYEEERSFFELAFLAADDGLALAQDHALPLVASRVCAVFALRPAAIRLDVHVPPIPPKDGEI
jgi:hypothetical protein